MKVESLKSKDTTKDMKQGQEKGLVDEGRVTLDRHLLLTTTQGTGPLTQQQILENYTNSPPLYMAINAISTRLSSVEFKWEDDNEPSKFSLSRPNKEHTGRQLFGLIAKYLKLVGECYLVKMQGIEGISLLPIRPDYVEIYNKDEFKLNTPIFDGTNSFDVEDVVHIKEPSVLDPYWEGESEGQSLTTELDIDSNAANHMSARLKNNARPDSIVSVQGNDKAIKAFKKQMMDGHKGPDNAGKSMAVPGGEVSVQTLSSSFKDLQMDKIREHTQAVIRQVFGIPPEVVGIVDNSNRATIESAEYIFTKNVIKPLAQTIVDTLNKEFVQKQLGSEYAIEIPEIVEDDKAFKLEVISNTIKHKPDLFSDEEIRELAGFSDNEETI